MTFYQQIRKLTGVSLERNTLCVYALALLAFGLSFPIYILPYLIGAVGISVFFQTNLRDKLWQTIIDWRFILLAGFYMLHLLGMLHTEHSRQGWFLIQVKLSLLLLPLIVLISRKAVHTHYRFILKSFIAGNMVTAVLCLVWAIYQLATMEISTDEAGLIHVAKSYLTFLFGPESILTYTRLSIFMHVNYYAIFILFTIYLVYLNITSKYKKMSVGAKRRHFLGLGALVFFFFLLQSRSAVIAAVFLMLAETIRQLRRPGMRLFKVVFLFGGVVLVLAVGVAGRMSVLHQGKGVPSYSELKEREIRLDLWERAIPIILESPFIGAGTGDAQGAFRKAFDEELLEKSLGQYYNVHNEYLQTAMRLGIPMAIFLLVLLSLPLISNREALYNHPYISVFILLVAVAFLFESMLNRLHGVVFFALFYSIFLVLLVRNKKNAFIRYREFQIMMCLLCHFHEFHQFLPVANS